MADLEVTPVNGAADAQTVALLASAVDAPAPTLSVTAVTPSVGEPTVTIKRGQRGPQKTARI